MEVDPDIIMGYNIISFGLRYLIIRAKHLNLKSFNLSHILGVESTIVEEIGRNKIINIEGSCQFDRLVVIIHD